MKNAKRRRLGSPDALSRSVSPVRVVIFLAVVAATAIVGFVTLGQYSRSEPGRTAEAGFRHSEDDLSLEPISPILGDEIPLELARELLDQCLCPGLPKSPEAGRIEKVWANDAGAVAVEFDSGLLMTVWPDARTSEEYVTQYAEEIAAGEYVGTVMPLRETLSVAADINRFGPASLSWIEGERIDLYGDGGQPLAELVKIAESMPQPATH